MVKFFVLFLLDGSFLHQDELKLTLMGLLGGILVLLLVDVFFVGVWRSLLVLSLRFLKFRLLCVEPSGVQALKMLNQVVFKL